MSRFISLYIGLAALSLQLHAADGVLRLSKPKTAEQTRASLSLTTMQYTSRSQNYFRDGAAPSQSSVGAELSLERGYSVFTGVLKMKDEYNTAERWNYADVHELYAGAQFGGMSFALGRKLESWTEWEAAWGQGIFQPRYIENKLRPEQAGLTGVFARFGGEHAALTLAALPLFLPDFGPHWDLSQNRFVSANPWFHPPAAEFQYRGVTNPIHYSVNRPSDSSVVNHGGAAAKFEIAGGNYLSRVSYAFKPIPQLLYGFPSRGFHPSKDVMEIQIGARTVYHQVLSWDGVARLGGWRLSLSATHEQPESGRGPDDFTSQQISPAWIFAASASHALEEEGPSAARFTLGVLNVQGGDAPDRGQFAGSETLFERRFQFQEAYMVEVHKPWRLIFPRPLDTGVRVIYDRAQNGGGVMLQSGMAFDRNWRADLQVDILGLSGGEARVKDGFLSTYRANDRVAMGMSYVF